MVKQVIVCWLIQLLIITLQGFIELQYIAAAAVRSMLPYILFKTVNHIISTNRGHTLRFEKKLRLVLVIDSPEAIESLEFAKRLLTLVP